MMNNSIGYVLGGDMNELTARLTVPLRDVQEGSFVVIESGRMRFYAMLSKIELGASSQEFAEGGLHRLPAKVRQLVTGEALYANIKLLPVLMQEDGIRGKVIAVKTLPEHYAEVTLAAGADIRLIYGDEAEPQNFVIGVTREQGHPVSVDIDKFVQRSSGIFGATGTGKSFLTRLTLAGLIHRNQASVLILDMHNEYGYDDTASDTGKTVVGLRTKFPHRVKVVGVGAKSIIRGKTPDFNLEIPTDEISIEDVLLLKNELDLNDTAASVLEALYSQFGIGWFRAFKAKTPGLQKQDTSDPKKPRMVWDPRSVEYWAKQAGVNQIAAVSLHTKMTRLFRRPYLNPQPAVDGIKEIVRLLLRGNHIVLSFGKNESDLDYLLVCNILTRKIREVWEYRTNDFRNGKGTAPRPLVIVVEEAHKLLSSGLANQTSFGTIAREMRKYYVTLLVVDQRPSQISAEVMSQLGTRITGWLGDDEDIHSVLVGLPGKEALRGMVTRLQKKEEVLLLGWGVPIPTPVRTTLYDEAFWKRLLSRPSGEATNITDDIPETEPFEGEGKDEQVEEPVEETVEDILDDLLNE